MIDFAKTLRVPERTLTHRDVWQPGNHEEGYLTGLDHLVSVSHISSGPGTLYTKDIPNVIFGIYLSTEYPLSYSASQSRSQIVVIELD